MKQALPEILSNRPPGPKAQPKAVAKIEKEKQVEKTAPCPKCGGKVRKNGRYWVSKLGADVDDGLVGIQKELLQRWRCKVCAYELVTPARSRQSKARQAWWQQVNRLIALSRFKLRLSVRLTQTVSSLCMLEKYQ